MLNFNRFKYRRKACLEFFSPNRSKNVSQPELLTQNEEDKKENEGSSNECNKDRPNDNVRRINGGKFNSVEGSRENDRYPRKKGPESYSSHVRNDMKINGANDRFSAEDGGQGDATFSTGSRRVEKEYMTGEDRLSNILCYGASTYKNRKDDNDQKDIQLINRKRKEPMKGSPKKIEDLSRKKVERYRSHENIRTKCSKSIDTYEIFKPKSKRKKLVLRVNSSDEEEDEIEKIPAESKALDDTSKDDVDKLREIYSHLTISEAKEAISVAGSLVDAIINLADSLNIQGNAP